MDDVPHNSPLPLGERDRVRGISGNVNCFVSAKEMG